MKKVLVFGAARSGVAAANYLAARDIDVTLTDARNESELALLKGLSPNVRRVLGGHPDSLLSGVDTIVLSPGIPKTIPILAEATRRGLPIISEIELAYRNLAGRVVAITGTNGKSTTTALLGEILRVAGRAPVVAGNIGDPLIAAIDPTPRDYVLELSSFQLETIDTFRADVALLLNITPDHLDRYDSMDAYAAAKYRVFRNQRPEDVAIVNADDERAASSPTKAKLWRFSAVTPQEAGAWFEGDTLVCNAGGAEERIARRDLRIEGSANVENALACWLAARALGISDRFVQEAFSTFSGLPHRMVLVRELDGVRFINDSKGTNVDATLKSLDAMPDQHVVLILGGKDKAGEFYRLRPLVERKARAVLTIGSAAEKIATELQGAAELVAARDMAGAVHWAEENSRPGDVVLLSPACASFDQYNNFEERGLHFERLVRQLGSEVKR